MDYISRSGGDMRTWYVSNELLEFITRYEG
jgi:hypothetical protein